MITPWTKADQAALDALEQRKAAHENDLQMGVFDLIKRLNIDEFDLAEKLIANRRAFIEVLERFDDEE